MLYISDTTPLILDEFLDKAQSELMATYCNILEEKLSLKVTGIISIVVSADCFTVSISNYGIDFYAEVSNVCALIARGLSTDKICDKIVSQYNRFLQGLFFK